MPCRSRLLGAPSALLVFVGLLCACGSSEPTRLYIQVDTDFNVPFQVDTIRFDVLGPSGSQTAATDLLVQPLPASLLMLHKGGPMGPFLVTVRAEKEGVLIQQTRARLSFEPHRTLYLRLSLLRECGTTRLCQSNEICTETACVPFDIDPGTLDEYPDPIFDDSGVTVGGPVDAATTRATMIDGGALSGDAAAEDPVPTDADAPVVSPPTPRDAGNPIQLDTGLSVSDSGRPDSGAPDSVRPDSGPPDSGLADSGQRDGGCGRARATCDNDTLVSCLPGGGIIETECTHGCREDRCRRARPSNDHDESVDFDARDLRMESAFNTSLCLGGRRQTANNGLPLCVLSVRAFTVPRSANVQVSGDAALVVLATGPIRIDGTLDLAARGERPGPGGANGGMPGLPDGGGPRGGGGGSSQGRTDDGGAGGGGLCGSGGDGGRGGDARGGEGGERLGGRAANLEPLVGGSGGGWSRGEDLVLFDDAGRGGGGGGAIQLFSTEWIRLDGSILVTGGGGLGGARSELFSTNPGGGGGGGSGGAVLLEAPRVEIGDSARINAGGGGGGGSASGEGDGRDGSDGRASLDRAAGGQSGGDEGGASGGRGGGGSHSDGDDGEDNRRREGANGGGGGGGAGCVVIRTDEAHLLDGINARISPSRAGLEITSIELN